MARLFGPEAALLDAPAWGLDPLGRRVGSYNRTFANPLYHGADPWVTRRDGWYYSINATASGRLEVWKSNTLTQRGQRQIVWTPPAHGWNRAQVWAPELHFVANPDGSGRGKWYIYYAASDGHNANHRMGVLEAATDDPQGPYIDRGQLYTGDSIETGRYNRWAIDGTVLPLGGRLYFIWSGWEDERDIQHLYVAEMANPWTVATNRVQICPNNCHTWERVGERHGERGLHEAPQVLVRNGKVFLVYSCSGSWEPTYKLGMLYMNADADPMNGLSWTKHNKPAFDCTREVFGVGHCCFTTSPDGTEDWILYHSKRHRWHGWSDRMVRAQPFTWTPDGLPDFGKPVPSGQAMRMPSDQVIAQRSAPAATLAQPDTVLRDQLPGTAGGGGGGGAIPTNAAASPDPLGV